MVAKECVSIFDNYHTFALTFGRPHALWTNSTPVCGLGEQVSNRLGDFSTLLHVILKEHILLLLGSNTLDTVHCKIFYIIVLRSCYTLRT